MTREQQIGFALAARIRDRLGLWREAKRIHAEGDAAGRQEDRLGDLLRKERRAGK